MLTLPGYAARIAAVCIALSASMMPKADAAQVPPFFINSVVALGSPQLTQAPGQPDRIEWQTVGTGFFYGYLIENSPEPSKRRYEIYLVTARHVVEQNLAVNRSELRVRINPKERATIIQEFSVPNTPKGVEASWFFHPDKSIDIAAVQINFNFLKELGYEPSFFPNDHATMVKTKLIETEVAAGDGIFVLGFPMNLAGTQRNYVIVRKGIIARISEMLENESKTYMIDALVFPGNSGGPVVLKPDIISIEGTKPQTNAALIGVVTSYRPYTEFGISSQTKRARILFEENSGLADVVPIDCVEETIEVWRKGQGRKNIIPSSSTQNEKN